MLNLTTLKHLIMRDLKLLEKNSKEDEGSNRIKIECTVREKNQFKIRKTNMHEPATYAHLHVSALLCYTMRNIVHRTRIGNIGRASSAKYIIYMPGTPTTHGPKRKHA